MTNAEQSGEQQAVDPQDERLQPHENQPARDDVRSTPGETAQSD